MSQPCRYCVARWAVPTTNPPGRVIVPEAQDCQWEHRDDPRVYALALAMAKVFQARKPTDAQIGYLLADANDVIDDFEPPPAEWTVRRLPGLRNDGIEGIEVRMKINNVTYVGLEGGHKERGRVVKLSVFRSW